MKCVHPKCGRDDLPPAPATPIRAKIACAHARPDGEPCTESPTGAYDDEARAVIATEPALWDPEVRPEPFALTELTELTETEVVTLPEPEATARQRGKPRRQDDVTKAAIASRLSALREGSPPQETRVIAPAKPGRVPVKKKAPANPAETDAQDQDVDDWNP